MTPPVCEERRNELFPNAVEQFMLQYTSLEYALRGPSSSSNVWELAIPTHICIGEITHGRKEHLYRKQKLPVDLWDRFNSFFGRFVLKNMRGETVAFVRLLSEQLHRDQTLLAHIRVEYGPSSLQQCPFPTLPVKNNRNDDVALTQQKKNLEDELERVQHDLSRHVTHMNTLLEQWHVMWDDFHRRCQVRHAHISRILLGWYTERPSREDCCVCWHAMAPNELTIPPCGHFICTTCHEKCTHCPLCREPYQPT